MLGYTIVSHGLSYSDKEKVKDFAKRYNLVYEEEFTENNKSLTKYILILKHQDWWVERSIKYYFGLAWNAWIVGMEWIRDCERVNRCILPEGYEIKGDRQTKKEGIPKSSRTSSKRKGGLFKNIMFIYKDTEYTGMSVGRLSSLLNRCGAIHDTTSNSCNFRSFHVVEKLYPRLENDQITVNNLLDHICKWKPILLSVCL